MKKVIVMPYDPNWKLEFEKIRNKLAEVLKDNVISNLFYKYYRKFIF